MNVRRQLYKKHRLSGMSAYQAAIKSGYSHNTAKNANKYMEKCGNWESLFVKAGIDDISLTKLIQEGLYAMKPIACDVFIRDENGVLKVNKNSNDWIDYEDWQARHKFIMTTLQLLNKIENKPLINIENHQHKTIIFRNPECLREEEDANSRCS